MKFKEFKYLIYSDLFRYTEKKLVFLLLKNICLNPGFKYTFWMRASLYLKRKGWFVLPFYVFARWLLKHYQFKYGISIPYNTNIGPGLYIGHFSGIVVNSDTVIGKNCNINQGVTVGTTYGGKQPGTPKIGDNVYIGPGSFIIGGISIGENVAIGANSVVTRDFPDNAVVAGSPAKHLSQNGSGEYVINKI